MFDLHLSRAQCAPPISGPASNVRSKSACNAFPVAADGGSHFLFWGERATQLIAQQVLESATQRDRHAEEAKASMPEDDNEKKRRSDPLDG